MILLLLACEAPLGAVDGPSMATAVAPVLTHLDRDRDGRVTAPEYTPQAFGSPPFAQADQDGSGALEVPELVALFTTLDPATFSPEVSAAGGAQPVKPGGRARPGGARAAQPAPPVGAPAGGAAPGGAAPGGAAPGGAAPARGPASRGPERGPIQRQNTEMLQFLVAEVQARSPDIPLPTEDQVARAGRAESLKAPIAQEVLAQLRDAWTQAGLTFPSGLIVEQPSPTP